MTDAPLTEQLSTIAKFMREAFCVDGNSRNVGCKINGKRHIATELNDSKRGRFYVLVVDNPSDIKVGAEVRA